MIRSSVYVALVDADAVFRSMLAHQLEEQSGGLLKVVMQSGNGAEFLACLEGGLPDVVLMDPVLPVLDGCVTAGYLRALFPEIVVAAFLQAGDDPDDERWSFRSGFHTRIRKTDDVYGIVSRIRRAVFGFEIRSETGSAGVAA